MADARMRTRRRAGYVLLTLFSLLLLGVAATLLISTQYRQYQTTRLELTGAHCILHLQDVAILVQQIRGLRLIQGRADSGVPDARLGELAPQLLAQVGDVESHVHPGLTCLDAGQTAQLRHFARRRMSTGNMTGRDAVFDEGTQLIKMLQDRMQDAAYDSGLVLDWEPGPYFLANLLSLRLPALLDAVSRLRGRAAALVADHAASEEDSRTVASRIEGVRIALDQAETELRAFAGVLPVMAKQLDAGWDEIRRALTDFMNLAGGVNMQGQPDIGAIELFDQGSQAIGSIRLLHGQVQQELEQLLRSRVAALRAEIFAALLAVLGLTVVLLYLHISFYRRERRLMDSLERMATTDILTGVGNRTRFEQDFGRHVTEAGRYGRSLSLVMLDVDHFKQINDSHGHATGDRVLRQLAGVVAAQIRAADALYRWGGEEFCVLSPETGLEGARESAERIRQAVAGAGFGDVTKVSVSLGVAQWGGGEGTDSFLHRVDEALYAAKQAGRDRVVTAPSPRHA